MKIVLIMEGETERCFLPHLRKFVQDRLVSNRPRLDSRLYDGRIPKGDKLKRIVERLLNAPRKPADAVIAITDVYTGTNPPEFLDAADAKRQMRAWVGDEQRFIPHAAQYDFEAWLLPYWDRIQQLAGSNRAAPGSLPEQVDHGKPPSQRLREVFRTGSRRKAYVKPRDAGRILQGADLLVSVQACAELKAFINSILTLCGADVIE